jgi:pyruvate/2-oxoglutarate dehydrogenase complex dihydrolipoamide acyltransferase (E2) component
MPNLKLVEKKNLSSFRRIAIGTWRTTKDPQVYGSLPLRMEKALAYLDEVRAKTGRRATLSHFMAKVVAHVLAEMPDANAVLRFNKIWLREDVGVFFQVEMKDEKTGEIDLSGATIFDCHKKSIVEIVDEFGARVAKVKAGKDEQLENTRSTFKKIPALLLGVFVDTLELLCFKLNLDLRAFGIPRDPFGSVMVTNIGSLGLEEGFVPLVPYSHVPLVLAMGKVVDAAVVEDGAVVPGKVMRLCATFDHRVLDGAHAAKMVKLLAPFFEDPVGRLGPIEAAPPAALAAPTNRALAGGVA